MIDENSELGYRPVLGERGGALRKVRSTRRRSAFLIGYDFVRSFRVSLETPVLRWIQKSLSNERIL